LIHLKSRLDCRFQITATGLDFLCAFKNSEDEAKYQNEACILHYNAIFHRIPSEKSNRFNSKVKSQLYRSVNHETLVNGTRFAFSQEFRFSTHAHTCSHFANFRHHGRMTTTVLPSTTRRLDRTVNAPSFDRESIPGGHIFAEQKEKMRILSTLFIFSSLRADASLALAPPKSLAANHGIHKVENGAPVSYVALQMSGGADTQETPTPKGGSVVTKAKKFIKNKFTESESEKLVKASTAGLAGT
jgi:hypothetical protein